MRRTTSPHRRCASSARSDSSPLRTIAAEGDARFAPIGALIAEWQPAALVVGIPFHPDGAPHDNTRRAQRFARQLHGRFGLPVHVALRIAYDGSAFDGQVTHTIARGARACLISCMSTLAQANRHEQVLELASPPDRLPAARHQLARVGLVVEPVGDLPGAGFGAGATLNSSSRVLWICLNDMSPIT